MEDCGVTCFRLPDLAADSGFAANLGSSGGLKITEAEALQIKELQVEAAEDSESEDLEHLEALTAQARSVMKKTVELAIRLSKKILNLSVIFKWELK